MRGSSPAAQALSTGRLVQDMTVLIAREGAERVSVSMSATPLREDGQTSGVVVTFRDITERRALEEQMQVQAERAQILADAGAFFSSNIDPTWVTQAIAERVAEVLGDWSAVILRTGEKELSVASIYHRDMTSLGLAWSYIYRQPLAVGEGIIGQVVSTGYPAMSSSSSRESITRQVRRTEAMIAGMSDGVMLVDGEGQHRLHQSRRPAPPRQVRRRRADLPAGRGLPPARRARAHARSAGAAGRAGALHRPRRCRT